LRPRDTVAAMTGTRSEWLRPISERYLEGEAGPAPATVKVATVLSGLNAIGAAALAVVYVPLTVDLIRDRPAGWGGSMIVAVIVSTVAIGLFVAFALSVWGLPKLGWSRIPMVAGWTWFALAALSFAMVFLANAGAQPGSALDTGDVTFVGLRAGAAAACALAMVLLLRRPGAANWLAKRRHHRP